MPNIKLIGFGGTEGLKLAHTIADKIVSETQGLDEKTIITQYSDTSVLDCLTRKKRPYICICNTREPGATQENFILTEVLKELGYDIEWGEIQEFFMAPKFERWTGGE